MDWKTFIVEMTKALAWPLSVLLIAFIFRRTFSRLLQRTLALRFRDFEVKFANEAGKVAESIPATTRAPPESAEEEDRLTALADRSPRAVIIEAWIQVEGELRQLAEAFDVEARRTSLSQLLQALERKEIIDSRTAQSIRGLMVLRNLAVHAPEPNLSPQKAIEFVTLARAILHVLTTLTRPNSPR